MSVVDLTTHLQKMQNAPELLSSLQAHLSEARRENSIHVLCTLLNASRLRSCPGCRLEMNELLQRGLTGLNRDN